MTAVKETVHGVTDQLRLLIELQTIDSDLISKDRAMKALPLRAEAILKPLSDSRASLEYHKRRQEDADRKRADREVTGKEIVDRLAKLKERSAQVKDTKSFNAHQREIEQAERDLKKSKAEAAGFAEQAASEKAEAAAASAMMAELEQKAVDLKETIANEIKYYEKELKEIKARRAGIISQIEPDLYTEYMRVLKKHQGLALAQVTTTVCGGCHMNIMPQLYVELQKSGDISECPQCGRLIYYKAEE